MNKLQSSINALKTLNDEQNITDLLLTEMMLMRIDMKIWIKFETQHSGIQSTHQLHWKKKLDIQFFDSSPAAKQQNKPTFQPKPKATQQIFIASSGQCHVCSQDHNLYLYLSWISEINIDQRFNVVKENRIFSNCLRSNHTWKDAS